MGVVAVHGERSDLWRAEGEALGTGSEQGEEEWELCELVTCVFVWTDLPTQPLRCSLSLFRPFPNPLHTHVHTPSRPLTWKKHTHLKPAASQLRARPLECSSMCTSPCPCGLVCTEYLTGRKGLQ